VTNGLTESRIEYVFFKPNFLHITEEKSMKYLITTVFAVILSTSFSLADGCGNHGDKTAMTCELGQEWNAELGMCMDTNA
jgi:hypothetical protein